MNKMKLAVMTIALLSLFTTGNALAADTAILDVTANVIETCRFDNDGALDFGNLDALAPADQLGIAPTTDINFTCSNGTAYTITDDSAANPLNNGTDNLAYTLTYTAGGTADGTSTAVGLTGDLLGAAYAGVSAGAYTATATFTINP